MQQNAYFLAKIGADTAENERKFAENLQIRPALRGPRGRLRGPRQRRAPPGPRASVPRVIQHSFRLFQHGYVNATRDNVLVKGTRKCFREIQEV